MNPTVVFLEDNNDLREILQSIVESSLRIRCATFDSVKAFKASEQAVLQSHIVVLDIELGFKQATGIDAYNWLMEKGFKGHIFFLTGHGCSNPLVESAAKMGATIWEKPISSNKIISHFKILLSEPAQDSRGAI